MTGEIDESELIAALVDVHRGLARLGPGSTAVSDDILRRLPSLPPGGAIADLGCGTGAASLLLARRFDRPVLSVDTSEVFLRELRERTRSHGMDHLITTRCADMGALDPTPHQFGLIWSEGAAYHLTFEGALRSWRPLLLPGGVAVVSELSWFRADPPPEARSYWSAAYPTMASEAVNLAHAQRHGYRALFTVRLPSADWWTSYYTPLAANLRRVSGAASRAIQTVITEAHDEMALFRACSDSYGYTYYVLQAGA